MDPVEFQRQLERQRQFQTAMSVIHERHVAIYQLIDNPETFSEMPFSRSSVTQISCADNDVANTYFKRAFDPNFKKLCQDFRDNPKEYFNKFKKMNPVLHEPVEPQKVNLDTFTALFNEDWTVADHEYMPDFYPHFPDYFTKENKDLLESWAKKEMLTYWPGARPENFLDGFQSVEDAMNHMIYKTPYCCGPNGRVGRTWRDAMAGKSIRPDQDANYGKTIGYFHNGELIEAEPVMNQMKERRKENNFRKERKEAKKVFATYVTKGKDENYDIEKVLKDLEIGSHSTSSNKKSKKSKSKKKKNQAANQISNQTARIEPSDHLDCSICFCPREQTFMVEPCGHATFCEGCTKRISNETPFRCPICQTTITRTKRIFQ